MLSLAARHRLDRGLLVLAVVAVFGLIVTVSENGNTNGPQVAFRVASIIFIVLTSPRAFIGRMRRRGDTGSAAISEDSRHREPN